jgi:uncharacterized protein
MGRSDSSTQFSGHSELCAANHGATQIAAPRVNRTLGAWALLFLVRLYVLFLSPVFGGACKFYPSCSNYAYEAVARHGARQGVVLAMKRLLRCRPGTKGGFDPVPDVLYREDALQEPKSSEIPSVVTAMSPAEHRPTQPVVAETWSAAGTLGVERRL